MTTPDLSFIIPTKYKTYVGLIGAGLSFLVPFVLEATEGLPAPWPAVIGAVLWILTALGVYKAPYKPTGTVLVPEETVKPPLRTTHDITVVRNNPAQMGEDIARRQQQYQNPWR